MKQILAFIICATLFCSCAQNLVTGRQQLELVSESELQALAKQEYQTFLQANKVLNASNNPNAQVVQRVGTRIAAAIKKFYDAKGQPSVVAGYQWEFNLVENPEVNAWCMPGGKVVVYTGLLAISQTEAALAVVLGHEIAHDVAQHGKERMSQLLLQQMGGTALEIALANKPQETQNLFMTAFAVGSTVGGVLPFSRKEENEADKYGLFFSAMAGYDPQVAIPFWERMAAASSGGQIEFLSDHPSDETRMANLKENMPQALKYYRQTAK